MRTIIYKFVKLEVNYSCHPEGIEVYGVYHKGEEITTLFEESDMINISERVEELLKSDR